MLRHLIAIGALAIAAPAFAQDAAPAPTAPPDIAAIVQADWPAYDQGAKGYLNQAEFSTWLTALKTNSGGADDPAKTTKWVSDSFKVTDKDSNAQVTPAELTAFLQSKAKPR
ncbi:hypothetical protein [Sphingobium boeckii]|uniref:EF-hand domain-containing protein n=1 Tax=Sphingobium boeckii TaxID=1082345 RepID=A0A7W9EF70_9SPHN|nr:hypothetical protein [Sphingobium boeckii]MBB5687003.1 hypothetical protein [Sphingobium boeckii]